MTRTEFMSAWGYVEGTAATRDLDALLEAVRREEREKLKPRTRQEEEALIDAGYVVHRTKRARADECQRCEGSGHIYSQSRKDGVYRELCPVCHGSAVAIRARSEPTGREGGG